MDSFILIYELCSIAILMLWPEGNSGSKVKGVASTRQLGDITFHDIFKSSA